MQEQMNLLEVEEGNYPGIDYGRGMTNIDTNTGIRFGVIPQYAVLEYWSEVSIPRYYHKHPDEFDEPDYWNYRNRRYWVESDDNFDLWVFRSPYYTLCQFCSPCAPGAGYILNPAQGAKAYCLGHEWFIEGKAPYKVFNVKTGKEVIV